MISRGFRVWCFSEWIKIARFLSSFLAGMMMDTPVDAPLGWSDFFGLGILHRKPKPRSQNKKRTKGVMVFFPPETKQAGPPSVLPRYLPMRLL
jgi:hypothetical protein